MSECLFCQIVSGAIPSSKVAESDAAYAFDDITPQAPVHVLVVPKQHLASADALTAQDSGLVDALVLLAHEVAEVKGIRESGYRLIMNVGPDALMSVPHLHMHVLGGRQLPGTLG